MEKLAERTLSFIESASLRQKVILFFGFAGLLAMLIARLAFQVVTSNWGVESLIGFFGFFLGAFAIFIMFLFATVNISISDRNFWGWLASFGTLFSIGPAFMHHAVGQEVTFIVTAVVAGGIAYVLSENDPETNFGTTMLSIGITGFAMDLVTVQMLGKLPFIIGVIFFGVALVVSWSVPNQFFKGRVTDITI